MKGEVVLNHKMIKIINNGSQYVALIALSKGGVVEHEPFPGDQRGLVAAMSLATDVLAGKVWLSHVHNEGSGWTAPSSLMLTKGGTND